MVPVEPEIEDDAVQTDLEGQCDDVELCWELISTICEHGAHENARDNGQGQTVHGLLERIVRHLITIVFVAVEETISMPEVAHQPELMNSIHNEGGTVQEEYRDMVEIPSG